MSGGARECFFLHYFQFGLDLFQLIRNQERNFGGESDISLKYFVRDLGRIIWSGKII
jgi:hypothetical protein